MDRGLVVRRGRRVRRGQRLVAGCAVVVAAVVVGSQLPLQHATPAADVLDGAPPPPAVAAAAAAPPSVDSDDEAVSACVRALERETGQTLDRSVDLELASAAGGWRITAIVESGDSLDCDITTTGTTRIGPTVRVDPDEPFPLGLQHLACREVEPGLLAVSTRTPDAEQQAQGALARALRHLDADTSDEVVGSLRADGAVGQLRAVYAWCLDSGWGGNRALLAD